MKDHRSKVFRGALEDLVESLDAVIRLARWDDAEAKPEPLVASASKLVARLGTADRLATSKFNGPPAEMTKVTALCAALKRLDSAYLAYRQDAEGPGSGPARAAEAAAALESEIAATTAGSAAWQ